MTAGGIVGVWGDTLARNSFRFSAALALDCPNPVSKPREASPASLAAAAAHGARHAQEST
ncbi:MAG: hypothetical protein V5B32_04010 [Candidatus Accumulibacter sp. UW26]